VRGFSKSKRKVVEIAVEWVQCGNTCHAAAKIVGSSSNTRLIFTRRRKDTKIVRNERTHIKTTNIRRCRIRKRWSTKAPSAKKKSRREGRLSLIERSLARITAAEKEHMKIGSDDEGLAAAKPVVLFCEEAVLTENVNDST
jgi:hypothetical protein